MDSVTVTVIIVIGVIALIEVVNFMLKIPLSSNPEGMIALAVFNKKDDIHSGLESIVHKLKLTDSEMIRKVIIIENNLSSLQLEICKDFCERYDFFEMSDVENISSLIFSTEK